MKIKKEWKK